MMPERVQSLSVGRLFRRIVKWEVVTGLDTVMGIRLSQMKTFLVVCESRSFTIASKRLYSTQSAVSKSIASLEQSLGFRLFDRLGSELRLTPAGEVLRDRWLDIVASVESSLNEAERIAGGGSDSIRVGLADEITSAVLDDVLQRFTAQHEDVDLMLLEYTTGELVGKLISGEVEAIVTVDFETGLLDRLGMQWAVVQDDSPLCVIVHESHPLAQHDSLSMEDLRGYEFMTLNRTTHETYATLLRDVCLAHGFDPQIGATAPNLRSAIATLAGAKRGMLLGNNYIRMTSHVRAVPLLNTQSRLIVAIGKGAPPLVDEFFDRVSSPRQ